MYIRLTFIHPWIRRYLAKTNKFACWDPDWKFLCKLNNTSRTALLRLRKKYSLLFIFNWRKCPLKKSCSLEWIKNGIVVRFTVGQKALYSPLAAWHVRCPCFVRVPSCWEDLLVGFLQLVIFWSQGHIRLVILPISHHGRVGSWALSQDPPLRKSLHPWSC